MMLPFSFQKGNKAAGCEDAPPVSNIKFSVVCDGLGGAGSTKHKVEEAGTVVMRTSGYLGSRVVADSVTDFYDVNYERIANILFSNGNSVIALQAVIEELKSTIKTALSTKMTKLGIDPMLTRKKALKIFPTTLASALYFQDSEKLKILAIWAGDSRVYVLSPTKGLQLLSLDDAVNADREMNSASEMNNCISAGNAFRLNYSIFEMDEPGIVFCCSDGCFDYLPSPLHFEWLVLQTILSCVPNVTSDNLGEAFANSVRDSVYQSIGDDTTMAGTIYKINSTNELRETFAVRMEQFGQLAIQMNDALKVQKNWRNEKDSAAKKCRLFENKVTADLRASVTDALIKKTPTMLCSYIGTLPCYADYQESIKAIDEQVDVECVAELESLDKQLIEMKEICVEMIVRDYLRWRRINQDVIGSTSSMIDFFSTRTRGAVKKNYNYLKPSTYVQPLNACIQLLKLPDFQRLGMKNTLADADVTEFVQSQMRSIETLVSILENDSPLFEDLWSQAYFSTDRFERERQEIDDMCAAIETVPVIYMSKLEMMYEDFPFKKQWGHSCHKRYWEEYSMVVIDSMQFKVIPTPGHSPGSVCIITNKYLISGDLLTNDSIGRTDFIGGNVNDMFFSLEKVLKLSDSLIVLPGHGAVTTMEKIKNCNPYVKRILQKI